jgi:hypothetical protein
MTNFYSKYRKYKHKCAKLISLNGGSVNIRGNEKLMEYLKSYIPKLSENKEYGGMRTVF